MSASRVNRAFGIDGAGPNRIVVEAVRRKGRVTWREIPRDDALRVVETECARGRAFAACAVPARDSFIRRLEAPFPSARKALSVFPSMLDVQLPFPLEECVYRFVHVQAGADGKTRALAAALPAAKLPLILARLNEDGVDPEWMDQEALALWRNMLRECPACAEGRAAVLYLGADRSVLVAGRDGMPTAAQGTAAVWEAGAGDAARDAFVQKIKQQLAGAGCLDGDDRLNLVLCGPHARDAAARLPELLPVKKDCPLPEDPAAFLARALAVGVVEASGWSVNLRGGPHEHPRVTARETRRRFRLFAAASFAAAAVLVLAYAAPALMERRHEALREELRDRAARITGMRTVPKGQEVLVAQRHVEESTAAYAVFNEWAEPTVYPAFRRVLEAARAFDVELQSVSVGPGSLVLTGSSAAWETPEELTRSYRDDGWKTNIERKNVAATGRTAFNVKARR